MRKILFLVVLFFWTSAFSSAQDLSKTDVLYYLNGKTFINKSSGATLSFGEMGSKLTVNKNAVFYQPDILILSKTTALINYYGITEPSLKAGLIVSPTTDIIVDRGGKSAYYWDPAATAPGSMPDMSKAIQVVHPKAETHSNYKISQTTEGIFLVTNTLTNSPGFYVADDRIYNKADPEGWVTQMSFAKAYLFIKDLKLGEMEHWRLPTIEELEIIYGLRHQINPKTRRLMYWSSTQSGNDPERAVKGIRFSDGSVIDVSKSTKGGSPYAVRDINPKGDLNSATKEKTLDQGTFTDSRDGQIYRTIEIGDQTWMAENLAYKSESGYFPEGQNEDNSSGYGLYYTWETANNVCPDGWQLPSRKNWWELYIFLKKDRSEEDKLIQKTDYGSKLKSVSGWENDGNGTDDYGFSGLPAGYYIHYGDGFSLWGVGESASWWSSTEMKTFEGNSSKSAFYLRLYDESTRLNYDANDRKYFAKNVRCLKGK